MMKTFLMSFLLFLPAAVFAAEPASKPAVAATQPADGLPELDPRIDKILSRMEKKGNDVKDLSCEIRYHVQDMIGLSEFKRVGKITFLRAEPNPMFKVHFEKLIESGIVTRDRQEWYVFRDRWLLEARQATKTVIKREVIREGEKVDLFSLDKAPFPIPFGQKKNEIRKHFIVSFVNPLKTDPKDTDHLICVPRKDSRVGREYSQLEFFISRKLGLPVKIVAHESDGTGEPTKSTTASFPDLTEKSINQKLKAESFVLPGETMKWEEIVEPLPKPRQEPPK